MIKALKSLSKKVPTVVVYPILPRPVLYDQNGLVSFARKFLIPIKLTGFKRLRKVKKYSNLLKEFKAAGKFDDNGHIADSWIASMSIAKVTKHSITLMKNF